MKPEDTAKYILELGLHQYGGYKKDDDNCIELSVAAILQLIDQAKVEAYKQGYIDAHKVQMDITDLKSSRGDK